MAYLEAGDIGNTRNHTEFALKVSQENIEKIMKRIQKSHLHGQFRCLNNELRM